MADKPIIISDDKNWQRTPTSATNLGVLFYSKKLKTIEPLGNFKDLYELYLGEPTPQHLSIIKGFQFQSLKKLILWKPKLKPTMSLDFLSAFNCLEYLRVFATDVGSLNGIEILHGLKTLEIIHIPKVSSLLPLAGLSNLESLTIESLPSWDASGKRLVFDSYEPLHKLSKLKKLKLGGTTTRDGSNKPNSF